MQALSPDGLLSWCAEYSPSSSGCDFKNGDCLSSMSFVVGRFLGGPIRLGDDERVRILANADYLERTATSLRSAVAWVEAGHNGHSREGVSGDADNDFLTKALRRASRAKPDSGGTCNGGVCILGCAAMVAERMPKATGLTHALGALEMKRILKAASILEEDADNLRAAVVTKE